ncbi:MFS general substrate transporter [Gautieria morchelliformis]|nr:MFS general substrate transporter [Gautieria morchelliformis]
MEKRGSDIQSYDDTTRNRIMTKRVLWKMDLHVLPALALLWLANFLDRTNVGNAAIAGLTKDLKLTGHQFNTALAVFYVTYIVSELPSNWLLKRVHANRWLPFLVGAWGIVTTLSGLMHTFGGLVAVRIFLGMCEGGILPGMVLYLSTMYKRHELQLRVGIFYASASISGAFGGLLAFGITKMNGIAGLAGWRWIFILEGIGTVVVACIAAILLPEGISTASFLTQEEREFALQRLRVSNYDTSRTADVVVRSAAGDSADLKEEHVQQIGTIGNSVLTEEEEVFEWGEVIRGLTDIQTWLTGFAYASIIVSLYSFSLFLPTIVAGLGFSGGQAQLHTVPPYVPAVVLTVVVALLADKLQWRGPFILICLPLSIIGYAIAIVAKTNTARYAAVFLIAAGVYPCGPCILTILPNNSSGHYKKATTTALQLMLGNCGGFVATFIYTPDQAPQYRRGHSITIGFVCLAWVLIACNVLYCLWENKARREGRREANWQEYERLWESGKTRAPIGDRSPAFRFTL